MNNNIEYCWPIDFPEDVPDKDKVIPANGKVYRLVRSCPPTESDFQSHRKENPDYKYLKKEEAKSHGVSLWSKLSELQKKVKKYPNPEQLGGRSIVFGDLCAELGVIPSRMRRDGHITLWVQDGAMPHNFINHKLDE